MSTLLFVFFGLCMLLGAGLLLFAPGRLHTSPDLHFSRAQAPHTTFHGLLSLGLASLEDTTPVKQICAALWVGLNLAIAAEARRAPSCYRRPGLVFWSHLGLALAFALWLVHVRRA